MMTRYIRTDELLMWEARDDGAVRGGGAMTMAVVGPRATDAARQQARDRAADAIAYREDVIIPDWQSTGFDPPSVHGARCRCFHCKARHATAERLRTWRVRADASHPREASDD